jgi:hypothetical protein
MTKPQTTPTPEPPWRSALRQAGLVGNQPERDVLTGRIPQVPGVKHAN